MIHATRKPSTSRIAGASSVSQEGGSAERIGCGGKSRRTHPNTMCKQDIDKAPAYISDDKTLMVDACIAPIVDALNRAGLKTIASCCGHGKQPSNIVLKDGREVVIAPDYESARVMDKLFPPINPWPRGNREWQLRRWLARKILKHGK